LCVGKWIFNGTLLSRKAKYLFNATMAYQVMSDASRSPTRPIQVPPTPEDQVMFPSGSELLQTNGSILPSVVQNDGTGNMNNTRSSEGQEGELKGSKSAQPHGGGHGGSQVDPYDLFKHQIGQKVGFSQWMWRYQQKKQHKMHLREMRSYVSEDVTAHRENVEHFKKYFFNPEAKAKAAEFENQKLQRENKSILKRLFKVSLAETPISAANNPKSRLLVAKKRNERLRAMRDSNQSKLNHINSENRLLLHRISSVRGSFDYKQMDSDYKRHIKLRDAMRKVDDPKPKRKKKGRRRQRRGGRESQGSSVSRVRSVDSLDAEMEATSRGNGNGHGGIDKISGTGNNIGTTFPALGKGASKARTKIGEEVRRRAAPEQPVQTSMITIDGRRALVKSWRDADAFRFQLADPETGAVRMLSLTDREVAQLSERFGELVSMVNTQKITFITAKLPLLLSGAM
tara:strand:- start:115 stop:1482 length:1368 start_codon:yes stop_codon:yes gene_type:complete